MAWRYVDKLDTIQNSIKRLKKIEDILENKINSYTKKEILRFENFAQKLNKALGGIKYGWKA